MGWKNWGFAFNYWCVLDPFQCEEYPEEWRQNIPESVYKFIPMEYMDFMDYKNVFPLNFYPAGHPENRTNYMNDVWGPELLKENYASDSPEIIYLGHTVTYALIQMAIVMGCNPIYLIGVDHQYNITEEDRKAGLWTQNSKDNHFDDSYSKEKKFQLPEPLKSERAFAFMRKWADRIGIEIINVTPGTALDTFEKGNYNSLFKGNGTTVVDFPNLNLGFSVTILVCSPDIDSRLFRESCSSLKAHTKVKYDLVVHETGKRGYFNHASELNRALASKTGNKFITLDDDVELTPGWDEALLDIADNDTGAVGCVNLNMRQSHKGTTRYVFSVFNNEGNVFPVNDPISEFSYSPYCCSCVMLINDDDVRFSEAYQKYYHEGDLCLELWEKGKVVKVSPHEIYHYGSGTMEELGYKSEDIKSISNSDRLVFKKKWIDTGRLREVYKVIQPLIDYKLPKI